MMSNTTQNKKEALKDYQKIDTAFDVLADGNIAKIIFTVEIFTALCMSLFGRPLV